MWQQGSLLEITIADLNTNGDGVGRWEGKVIFVPQTVPGDRVECRLDRVKRAYAQATLLQIIEPSEYRVKPQCIVADKCGGCQWQHVSIAYQRTSKVNQVQEALGRIGGFKELQLEPILTGLDDFHYRNKVTYPLQLDTDIGSVKAGYYRKGTHKLINLNQCPVQDDRLDRFLATIKKDIQYQEWPIYDEASGQGKLRHLSLRIGRRTGEVLLTLVSTTKKLNEIQAQAERWLQTYPELVGVCVNVNTRSGNTIFGNKTYLITGREYVIEEFADLKLRLGPNTFFQVNTEVAEALIQEIIKLLQLTGTETIIDAYCGIGTFTLPLAKLVKTAIGIESQEEAVRQGATNAEANGIDNVDFYVGKVEKILPALEQPADVVLLDPPRKGCDSRVLEALRAQSPDRIVYVSCNPSTLARDLKILCEGNQYQLSQIQPADFFPQTSHVETFVILTKNP
jgi:23S rRNA (uracil1939-C5)-methyltransferase